MDQNQVERCRPPTEQQAPEHEDLNLSPLPRPARSWPPELAPRAQNTTTTTSSTTTLASAITTRPCSRKGSRFVVRAFTWTTIHTTCASCAILTSATTLLHLSSTRTRSGNGALGKRSSTMTGTSTMITRNLQRRRRRRATRKTPSPAGEVGALSHRGGNFALSWLDAG